MAPKALVEAVVSDRADCLVKVEDEMKVRVLAVMIAAPPQVMLLLLFSATAFERKVEFRTVKLRMPV